MREIPPTAGLPLTWRDLWPSSSPAMLATQLSGLLGIEAVQVTCSGTAALVIALSALAMDSDRKEVVVPGYTCPLVALAAAHCGLTIRLCDIDPDTLAMNPSALASQCGPRTLAIVPTFIGGRIHDIRPVLDIAHQIGAWVIEDAAQAMGARHCDNTPVGMRGDIGFHSLAVGKGLTMYEGGVLMSRHAHLMQRFAGIATAIASPRIGWELRRSAELLAYAAFYRPTMLPFFYGAPLRRALRRQDTAAAAGDEIPSKIPLHCVGMWRQKVTARAAQRWPDHLRVTALQGCLRAACLASIAGVDVISDAPGCHGVWPTLMLLMPDARSRDAMLEHLWGAGVGISVPFARVLPDYAGLRDLIEPGANVTQARTVAARILSISNSPWLDDATFQRVVAGLKQAIS